MPTPVWVKAERGARRGDDMIGMIYRVMAKMVNPFPVAAHQENFFAFAHSANWNILSTGFFLNDHQIPIDFYGFTM